MKGARFPRATAKRVILEGDVYNDIVTRLERAENLSVGAGLTLYDEPAGKVIAADPSGQSIYRYQVTTAAAAPDTVLAKRFNGTVVSGSEVPIRVYWAREIGEELFAFKPVGGTDAIYAGKPVQLEELWTPPRLQYDGMVMTQEGGQWVGAFTQAPALPTL
jgi:hypothetical protein